jgi:hypothetical protein
VRYVVYIYVVSRLRANHINISSKYFGLTQGKKGLVLETTILKDGR